MPYILQYSLRLNLFYFVFFQLVPVFSTYKQNISLSSDEKLNLSKPKSPSKHPVPLQAEPFIKSVSSETLPSRNTPATSSNTQPKPSALNTNVTKSVSVAKQETAKHDQQPKRYVYFLYFILLMKSFRYVLIISPLVCLCENFYIKNLDNFSKLS